MLFKIAVCTHEMDRLTEVDVSDRGDMKFVLYWALSMQQAYGGDYGVLRCNMATFTRALYLVETTNFKMMFKLRQGYMRQMAEALAKQVGGQVAMIATSDPSTEGVDCEVDRELGFLREVVDMYVANPELELFIVHA